jgi:hypothetical protein
MGVTGSEGTYRKEPVDSEPPDRQLAWASNWALVLNFRARLSRVSPETTTTPIHPTGGVQAVGGTRVLVAVGAEVPEGRICGVADAVTVTNKIGEGETWLAAAVGAGGEVKFSDRARERPPITSPRDITEIAIATPNWRRAGFISSLFQRPYVPWVRRG